MEQATIQIPGSKSFGEENPRISFDALFLHLRKVNCQAAIHNRSLENFITLPFSSL
jgi:hypothetical protein